MDIGRNIKALREAKGLTQAQLADLIDLDTSSVARLEKRANAITVHQLLRVAEALGCESVNDIITYGTEGEVVKLKRTVAELTKLKEEWKIFAGQRTTIGLSQAYALEAAAKAIRATEPAERDLYTRMFKDLLEGLKKLLDDNTALPPLND